MKLEKKNLEETTKQQIALKKWKNRPKMVEMVKNLFVGIIML